jgi:hypothetical protein
LFVSDSGTIDFENSVSDHRGTFVYLKSKIEKNSAYKRNVWLYKSGDFDKLNRLIESTDWDSKILDAVDIDQATENFTSTFVSHVRECVPKKSIIIRPQDKPWFDSGLRKAIKLRNRLRNKSLKSKNSFDLEKFRKARNKVNNMKKTCYAKLLQQPRNTTFRCLYK